MDVSSAETVNSLENPAGVPWSHKAERTCLNRVSRKSPPAGCGGTVIRIQRWRIPVVLTFKLWSSADDISCQSTEKQHAVGSEEEGHTELPAPPPPAACLVLKQWRGCLKKEIQLNRFKDQIGFIIKHPIQWTERSSKEQNEMEDFCSEKGQRAEGGMNWIA